MQLLILRPGAPSLGWQLRKRWLLAALPIGLLSLGLGTLSGPCAGLVSLLLGPPLHRTEKERLLRFAQKLSQVEQQLERLGVQSAARRAGQQWLQYRFAPP